MFCMNFPIYTFQQFVFQVSTVYQNFGLYPNKHKPKIISTCRRIKCLLTSNAERYSLVGVPERQYRNILISGT